MSEDVLLFSDIHIYCHKRRVERLEDCLKALNWVFDVAEEKGINHVLFGGDLFHDRQKIDIFTYQRVFEILKNRLVKLAHNTKNKFKLYLLLGNHDLWYNDNTSISSVFPLSALPGIEIISDPTRLHIADHNWDFIPFTHDPIRSLEELSKFPGKPEYALGHIAIDGAILHGTQYSDVEIEHDGDMVTISASLFDSYIHTFLGHYHAQQEVTKKVEYIGSPLELSFGEAFQNKHIIIFNGKTKKKEYVQNNFSPKHLVISIEDKDKYELNGNFVKIKVDDIGVTDLISMRKELLESNEFGSLEIKQQKKQLDEHVIQDAKAILYKGEEMLEKYIDEVEANSKLDREKLLRIGKKICQKKKE